jgi:hypothetical protein
MLSAPPQTRWPDDGELDIMEHVGFDPGVVLPPRTPGRTTTCAAITALPPPRSRTPAPRSSLPAALDGLARHRGVDDVNYYQYSNDNSET